MSVSNWQIDGTMAKAQRTAIVEALTACDYSVSAAAQRLRIGRTTLYRLIGAYDIDAPVRQRRKRIGEEPGDARPPGNGGSRIVVVDGDWYLVDGGAD